MGKKKGEISSEISFFWGFPVFFGIFLFEKKFEKRKREERGRKLNEEDERMKRRRKEKEKKEGKKCKSGTAFFFSGKSQRGSPR